jgi:anti-sigma-K factor RskA
LGSPVVLASNLSISRRKAWIPAVVAAAIILVITIPFLLKETPSYPSPSVVEYIESPTNNVMVYESEKPNVTIIWLFEGLEEESSPS